MEERGRWWERNSAWRREREKEGKRDIGMITLAMGGYEKNGD